MADPMFGPEFLAKQAEEFFKHFANKPIEEAVRDRQALENILEGMGGGLGQGGPADRAIEAIRRGADPRQWTRGDVLRHSHEMIREIARRQDASSQRADMIANNINDVINIGGQLIQDVADLRNIIGFEGRAAREEKYQQEAPDPNIIDNLGALADEVIDGVLNGAGVPPDQQGIIKGIIDRNKDGKIDGGEVKSLFDDDSAINKIANLSPAFARMIREPNFRMRTIEKITAPTIGGTNPRDKFNQVSTVEQAYANYDLAENMFNVNF